MGKYIRLLSQILYISQTLPKHAEWKDSLALTLSTYYISQTNQNLSTHLHQPDYTNPFQIGKKTPSEKQYSPYPMYLSHQPDRSEKQYSPYPIYLSRQPDRS